MICAKHKRTYTKSCPDCDTEATRKETNLRETLASLPRGGVDSRSLKWNVNPAYAGGRRYPPEFRSKVRSAMQFLVNAYGALLDRKKMGDLQNAIQGNLDDVFAVAPDDQVWTNVVHALGGQHGDAVYGDDGTVLGIMQSYGCTTYSRVDVNADDKHASKDDHITMMAMLDDSKRIYLHGTGVHLSTVVHEMLHFFCNRKFYDSFAQPGVGKEWRAVNEGTTEYLTREAYRGDNHGAYEEELGKVMILLKAGLTKQEIQAAYFQGQTQALVDKMTAGEMKAENMNASDPRAAAALNAGAGRRRGAGGPD